MMGAIVLSMLLGWFGVVAALTIWSGSGDEHTTEESVSATGAPRIAPDESQTSTSIGA